MSQLSDRLATLDARLDERLTESVSDDERASLKSDIIALIREADRAIAELEAIRASARDLAAKWKRLPAAPLEQEPTSVAAGAAVAATSATTATTDVLTTRVDHLGASTFVAKGWSAISVGDHASGEQALARALALAPEDLEAAAPYWLALMGQGRLDEALAVLQGVLAREPSHELARVNVGYVCLAKGIYGEAIEHLVRAARSGVDRKASLYANHYLGLVYLQREMYDDAVAFFHRALALGPNLLEARFELGRALWFGGDRDGALEAWRAGASAGKFNAWAKRCDEMRVIVEQGGEPPPVASAA